MMRPGCANQNVDTRLNVDALLLVVGAAKCEADNQARVFAEDFCVLGDLHGEFAGGRQHERTRLFLALDGRLGVQQALKGGDQERGGFARARLSLSGDIPLFERDRERARLNRRAKVEARIADSRLNALIEHK